ncbi:MAG: triose-phosphate isomerase, partial [Gallionellaceae bacterium]|nr:triose-phosphate isomerase [Gallionellaceae bacterium]
MSITILVMINPLLNSTSEFFRQAHSSLEMRPSFRLIPRWIRLSLAFARRCRYNAGLRIDASVPSMRTKLVAGNWKMHGSLATNLGLLHAVRDGAKGSAEVAICVPYPYLAQARTVLDGSSVAWGAQDVSEHAQG